MMGWHGLGPYSVFSDIALGGLSALSGNDRAPDIVIVSERRAVVGLDWSQIYSVGERDVAGCVSLWCDRVDAPREFCLRFERREHVAAFFLSADGRRVTVSASPEIPHAYLVTLIEGPVLGRALRLQGRPCLHATMLSYNNRAIGFMGASGAGKSTIATILVAQGCILLNDDLAILASRDGGAAVYPGRANVRLWPEAAVKLPIDLTTAQPILDGVGRIAKLSITAGVKDPSNSPVELATLYQLAPRENNLEEAHVADLPKATALAAIAANLYGSIRPAAPVRRAEMQFAAEVAANVPVRRLTLPDSVNYLIDQSVDLRDRLF